MAANTDKMKYQCFFKDRHYTFSELVQHCQEIKRFFPAAHIQFFPGKIKLFLKLRPTEASIEYVIQLVAKQNKKTVDIFVVNPRIGLLKNNKKVPHMYSDGTLCLYYPKNNEWCYKDSWAETLIPWTSLWLFYYEMWLETGEWLGGGIHFNPKSITH